MNQSDTSYKLGAGFIGALVSYLLGLMLTYSVTKIDVEVLSDGFVADTLFQEIQFGGLFYHGAHFVQIVANIQTMEVQESDSFWLHEFLQETGEITLPIFIYYLVPIIALALGTLVVIRLLDEKNLSMKDNAVNALHIVPGFFILTMVGTFTFRISQETAIAILTIGPNIVQSVIIMGIIYPAILSLLSSVVFYKIAERFTD